MKKITKKLCSTVCALLAFSGNRGGALTKEALYMTKEILCNAGQWYACYGGYIETYKVFYIRNKEKKWILDTELTRGQKVFGYAIGIPTIANAVDAAKRSYDIAHDVIKGSNNKPDTTNNKESTNYWPILEAIFGVSQFAYAFGHRPILDCQCEGVCGSMVACSISGLASMADAYFRFCRSNQIEQSPKNSKEKPNVVDKNSIQPQKSQNPEMKQKS